MNENQADDKSKRGCLSILLTLVGLAFLASFIFCSPKLHEVFNTPGMIAFLVLGLIIFAIAGALS